MAKRIRLSRAKGWRMPEGAVKVDRTTPFGNPFVVGRDGTRQECVRLHKCLMGGLLALTARATLEEQKAALDYARAHIGDLKDKDLACWCGPGPCHADTLLECVASAAEDFPKPRRNDGGSPCGECHIRTGETCDICGAVCPTDKDTK